MNSSHWKSITVTKTAKRFYVQTRDKNTFPKWGSDSNRTQLRGFGPCQPQLIYVTLTDEFKSSNSCTSAYCLVAICNCDFGSVIGIAKWENSRKCLRYYLFWWRERSYVTSTYWYCAVQIFAFAEEKSTAHFWGTFKHLKLRS